MDEETETQKPCQNTYKLKRNDVPFKENTYENEYYNG